MELQPVLEGPRLRLRPLKPADFEPLYAAASDPLIWEQHPCSDRHERPVFEAFFNQGLRSRGALAIEERATGRLIGTSRYYDLDGRESVAIGFTFLTRAHWGGSWNRELKFLMLDHAFIYVRRAIFHVGEKNLRSRRALEKIGASLAGRLERVKPDGTPDPTVVFELRRP
jgi:RimJ/RimL family protein N-acetyltransferase